MKNAALLLSLAVSAILTSCAGLDPTRIIGKTVAAASGVFIGKKLSNGNPLIATATVAKADLLDGAWRR